MVLSFLIVVALIAMIAPILWFLARPEPPQESRRQGSKSRARPKDSGFWAGGDSAGFGNARPAHDPASSHHSTGSHVITNSPSLHTFDGIDGDGGE